MPTAKKSNTKTIEQVKATTLADVKRLLDLPRVTTSVAKRLQQIVAAAKKST